jgi:ribosomal protein L22
MTESPRDPRIEDDETAALDPAAGETEAVTSASDALRASEAAGEQAAPAAGEPVVADDETPAAAADEPAEPAAASEPEPAAPDATEEPATDAPPAPEESPATAPTTSAPPVTAAPKRRSGGGQGAAPAETVVVRAQAKYVRTSARKARLVCDHIRGKSVTEARAILAFTPRAAAKPWSKLLESAIANAENNHELVGEDLRITAVYADEGPTLKRFQPRAMGRATRIRKRTSHLTILLSPSDVPSTRGGRNRRKGGR